MSNDFKCPHCDKVCFYTGDPIDEDEETEVECRHCGKISVVFASIIVRYYARCCDNDHEFEQTDEELLSRVIDNQYARIYKTCIKCGAVIAINKTKIG